MGGMKRNEQATISVDLLFAVILMMGALIAVILVMPTISHGDRDWRIKQYMTATRATDSLVQDAGDAQWEEEWNAANYSNVTTIGLVYVDAEHQSNNKVLSKAKVEALMGEGTVNNGFIWWDFPNSTTSIAERENATRTLGLTGYHFYMQLHPVGVYLDVTPLEPNLAKWRNTKTVSVVDRYVYLKYHSGKYLEYDNEVMHYRLNMWVW